MNDITIEKGVIFEKQSGSLTSQISKMQVGDSFVIEKSRRNGMNTLFRSIGMKCSTRTISDTEVRVWRTA